MAPTRRLQPRFFQPRCPNQSDFTTVFSTTVFSTTVFSTTVSSARCLQHGVSSTVSQALCLKHCVSSTVSQTRCLKHGLFSRGVLHHGFLHHGVSTTVFSSAVFSNTAPSFPPWSSRPHWRFHQRLAWPAGRTGWQSHPTGSVSACRPTAATWTPRQYHPARLKSWPSTGFMIPVRSTRAVMGVPGLKGRGWLSEMAPGNSSRE